MNVAIGYLAVFAGAGLGGAIRHAVNRAAFASGHAFPWNTLAVNVTGSLLMGLLAGWFAFRGQGSSQPFQLILTTGILGGYTTFSAFSLDVVLMWERGQILLAAFYVIGSVTLSIAVAFAGLFIIRQVA